MTQGRFEATEKHFQLSGDFGQKKENHLKFDIIESNQEPIIQENEGFLFMHKDKDLQLSIYSVLYNKIPENHKLKLLKDVVDYSFINEKLKKNLL